MRTTHTGKSRCRTWRLLLALVLACGITGATDMDTVETRIIADVMATLPTDSTVQTRMNTLGVDGRWSALTYNQTSTTDTHLKYMRDIARAYNSPVSSHYQSTTARDKYLLAFDGWVTANPNHDNWWWKDIGYPLALGEGMLLMRSQLSSAQITSGNSLLAYSYLPRSNVGLENTGANRTDRSYGTMMRAILSVNNSLLTESFLSIGDTILFTTLEGMQPDGSYHQHEAQLYTGGYGKGFGTSIPKYGSYGSGTVYKYGLRQIRDYTDWLLDGTHWMLRGPLIDHSVLGRGIVNNAQSAADFLYAAERTLPMAGDYRASELEAMRVRLESDLATKVADPALALSGNRMFWRSDYMTHHRPGFMASLRTASTRTIECEVINEQNKKGLHQSDGMLLINRRGDEYTGLMPVWDWQRLPGTTIEQASYSLRPRPEGATPDWLYGTSTHAGGVSDGNDGAMAYIYSKRNVSARKSWFFVGDAMLALGAGINASAAISNVLTTLNQSYLKTTVTYSIGAGLQTLTSGTVTPAGLQWVHHDETGYFFPGGINSATIRAQEQTGRLYDVNGYGTSTPYMVVQTQDVFSVDINHGTAFTGGSYAYVVVPGLAVGAMESYSLNDLTILSNTSTIQAMKSVTNGLTMANFFAAGSVDGITVSHSCSLMVRDNGNTIEVTVSDPKQVITGDLTVQIARLAAGLIEADGEVTVDQFSPTISLRLRMAGSTGRSLKAKFHTAPTAYPKVMLSPVADSYATDTAAGSNYGTATGLRTKVDASSGDWCESYLKFDLSSISNTPIAARLVLHPTVISGTPKLHTVAAVTNHVWTEGGITWNNRPQPGWQTLAPWFLKSGEPVRVDVLKPVLDFKGSGGELSLWLAPHMQADGLVSFASREHATEALRPTLELTFQALFGVDNSLGATVLPGMAQLNGWLVDGPADVTIYWGDNDGGTTTSWDHALVLTNYPGGTFASMVSNLTTGTTYYYRCFADSGVETAWATNTASFVAPSPASVQLGNLSQTYNGTARTVTTTTDPAGISVAVTYNGSTLAPTNAGSYAVVATINEPAYWGSTNGTLTVAKATPTVTNWPTASGIIEWQSLSASVFSGGGAEYLGMPVSGSFVFDSPATKPTAGVYTAAVSFVASDTINFNPVPGGQVEVLVGENLPPVVDAGPDQNIFMVQTLWTPAEIPTRAWYDTSDANSITLVSDKVTQWNDKSGNSNHATQGTATNRPTYQASDPLMNNLPSIGHATAAGKIGLNTPSMPAKNVYVVTYYKDGADTTFDSYATLLSGPGSYGTYRIMGNTNTASLITSSQFNDAGTYKNGSAINTNGVLPMGASVFKFKSSVSRTQVFSLGFNSTSTDRDWQGAYSEWIFTDGTDDAATEQKIEGYLAHKWGLTANLPADHPYKQSPPRETLATLNGTVSDPEGNSTMSQWTQVNGPVGVSFANAASVDTVASFPTNGVYTLRLTTNDGYGSSFDECVITVEGGWTNTLPSVDAGTNQVVTAGNRPWTPAELATAAWYDASDASTLTTNGNSVSEWRDKSGNTNHAVQANASLQPQIGTGANAINGLNTLVSQATVGEFMTMPRAITLSDYSVFGVLKAQSDPVDALTRMGVLAGVSNAWDGFTMSFMEPSGGGIIRANTEDDSGKAATVPLGTCTSLATPFIYSNVRVKSPVNIDTYFYNGDSGTSGGALTNNLTLQVLFRGYAGQIGGNGQPWNGSVGEVIVVSSALSAVLRQKIEGYLAHKWGLAGDLPADHPCKSAAPSMSAPATAVLDGTVSDIDNDPLTTTWTLQSGPATVTFVDASAVDTTASFPTNGVYTLRLTAVDGSGSSYDTCVITVGDAPAKLPASVTLGNLSQTYDGTARIVTATTAPEGLAVNFTYNGSATPPVNVGSYAVTGTVVSTAYEGSTNGTLVVNPATLTVTPSAGLSKALGESDPVLAYTSSGAAVGETAAFSGALARDSGETIGTYAITQGSLALAENGTFLAANYTLFFTAGVNFTIGGKSVTTLTVSSVGPFVYDGAAKTPEPEVKDGETVLTKDTDYTLAYADNTDAGSATLTVTGLANYFGVTNTFFTISQATPTVNAWPTGSVITVGQALSDSTLDGGSASVAGTFTFTAPSTTSTEGVYTAAVTFAASDSINYANVGGTAVLTVKPLPQHTLPFVENFEARNLGTLDGQNDWSALDTLVQNQTVLSGTNAVRITSEAGFVEHSFEGNATNVWTDFTFQPVFFDSAPTLPEPPGTVMFYFNTAGHPVVYSNTTPVELTAFTVTAGAWTRVTIKSDYETRKWDFYVNLVKAATGLDFYPSAPVRYTKIRVSGAGTASVALDDLSIGLLPPWPNKGTLIQFHF